ncbi:MAG: secretin and TonB N-terminal domain-containing protein [Vicinamibacterales bacterium]
MTYTPERIRVRDAHQSGWRACALVVTLALLIAGCATGRAASRGDRAARAGDWDAAVSFYRQALQQNPNRVDFQIALERAMLSASRVHLDQARVFEARGQLEEALREYRRGSEFDPPNRQVAAKVLEIERRIRDLAEAAQPRTSIAQLREQARQAGAQPVLIAANEPVPGLRIAMASLRDTLNFIGMATGINVTFEGTYQDRAVSVQLDNVTLEQALNQLLAANQLFYKVVNQRTIMVIPDNAQKRAQYEEQVIRTFFLSHGDATELAQIVNTVIRLPAMAVQPQIVANKTSNTITVRATNPVVAIIEKIIEANDNPRAEVVIDVQVLEVNRTRAKTFGLNLSDYGVGAAFSPEAAPAAGTITPTPFNMNTVTRGISTADFYLAVPSAVVRFLEADSETKLIAKPQLRGAEGQKITLNIGDEIPVPATVFTPIAQGGANTNPLTSFNYRTVGIIIEMTPRVTPEGDVILDLLVENSTRGQDVNVAGQNLPSFGTRRVNTRLRLRDGESNLLAGLLRETDRKTLRGIPGLLRLPILNKLLASNDTELLQTDIVMLLTPRIVRTQELTVQDLSPIFIGTQQNLGLGGPPPLIAVPDAVDPTTAPGAQPAPGGVSVIPAGPSIAGGASQPAAALGGGVAVVPPGSSPLPGTTSVPAAASPAPAAASGVEGAAQIVVTPPGADFRVGGGPYTVALSATNVSRLSAISLTLTYNPAALRVRAVQEGSLMRAGGATASFTQQVDAATGRVDIAIIRNSDTTGVAGTGLLAALVFDAVGGGGGGLAVTGTATAPGGAFIPLQFAPVPGVVVR